MGYYKPLFRRPYYRDWPVIAAAWTALLTSVAYGLGNAAPISLGRMVLIALVVFPVTAWLLAFIRQRVTRWR